jgi:hypothetical protein
MSVTKLGLNARRLLEIRIVQDALIGMGFSPGSNCESLINELNYKDYTVYFLANVATVWYQGYRISDLIFDYNSESFSKTLLSSVNVLLKNKSVM